MIEITILQSNDQIKIGQYRFFQNTISFGSDIENQIFLPNDHLSKCHLKLEVAEKKLQLIPDASVKSFHVNQKKFNSIKTLKANDHIKIGDCTFKIDHFSLEIVPPKSEFLNMKVESMQNNDPDLLSILQDLN